jgi:hypothetical protein
VVIKTTDGRSIAGHFDGVAAGALRLRRGDATRTFQEGDVREIRRRGDRLWNGALLGLGAGGVAGLLIGGRQQCDGEGICGAVGFGAGALIGSLIGLVTDAVMPHNDVLYRRADAQGQRWYVDPVIGNRAYGATLVVRLGRSDERQPVRQTIEPR